MTTMTTASNSYGSAWGDYDGDGDLDLSVGIAASGANQLWRNDAVGCMFVNAAGTAGVGNTSSGAYATSWGDFDGDGDLDPYVATNTTNVLYSNDGDGTFTASGQAKPGGRLVPGGRRGDYDGDGDPDLYVANYASSQCAVSA